jgi:hypothetical protein
MAKANSTNPVTPEMALRSDNLAEKLSHLRMMAEVAAFATEARRVLEGVEAISHHYPAFEDHLRSEVEGHRQWTTMQGSEASLMTYVAERITEVHDELVNFAYMPAPDKVAASPNT